MTYGKEDTDYRTDGASSSGYVFNAATSVFWCRIRDLMQDDLTKLYQTLDDEGCWSSSSLINEFDTWQSQFPEELWRLDIERKYYRTYQGGGLNGTPTPRFLSQMMNGRKKYQRRQFERDQAIYMGTKYLSTSVKADQIMFRCNTPSGVVVSPDYTLRIVPYSDMYLSVLFGNSSSVNRVRAKAGNEYEILCPFTQMDDTAILIYCASRIQALNDLSACYIHDNDFSKASKLKKLIVGNTTSGYSNEFLTNLNIGNNPLLEELDVRNCPNLVGSVNLSNCGNLEKFYATNTSITGVTFAQNGKIVSAYLPETINTLSLRNLNYLTDLQATYDNLESFTEEYSIVDEKAIVEDAVDTLQILRLAGIDWTLTSTDLLNKILKMNSSTLIGHVYINGDVRLKELEDYAAAWNDLTVDYKDIITQYKATFLNADGTPIKDKNGNDYVQLVDQGMSPVDPIVTGEVDTPTIESTAQYDYTFSEWVGIGTTMLADTTITAKYESSIRKYTIRWFEKEGDEVPLAKKTDVPYGSCVEYDGNWPTYTNNGQFSKYYVFTGWDKSTSFITGDIDVYAKWDLSNGLPAKGTDLSAMTPVQIYAVANSGTANDYFVDKDSFEVRVGQDYSFSNVEENLMADELELDGTKGKVIDTGIKLFGEDSGSFTIAIDFEFGDNSTDATLLSCYELSGTKGFRLKYDAANSLGAVPVIEWGGLTQVVGRKKQRDIVVLRHIKGENDLHIYSFNGGATSDDVYADDITYTKLTCNSSSNASTEATIMLGAFKSLSTGNIAEQYMANGTIHWAKVWLEDLGDTAARNLAAWPHETWSFEYYGKNRYFIDVDALTMTGASFIMSDLLPYTYRMNSTNINKGGWADSEMRAFCNNRIYNAFPTVWKSIIKQANIPASEGNMSTTVITTKDYVYLPSYTEMANSASDYFATEGEHISWFTSDTARKKTRNGVASTYGGRSPNLKYQTYFFHVNVSGGCTSNITSQTTRGICPCISI